MANEKADKTKSYFHELIQGMRNIGQDFFSSTCRHRRIHDGVGGASVKFTVRHFFFLGERVHATILPFPIWKYLWQRIINLLPKHIEFNKFSINHLYLRSGGVVIGQIRNAIAHCVR